MNPVAMTIINIPKEIARAGHRTSNLLLSSPQRYRLSYDPFPNKTWFLHVCGTSLSKTLWEKVKLLVTSIFSFYHSVFYPFEERSAIFIKFEIVLFKLFLFGGVQNFLFRKGLLGSATNFRLFQSERVCS